MTSFKPCKHDKHPLECLDCVVTEETKKRFKEKFPRFNPEIGLVTATEEELLAFIESECQRRKYLENLRCVEILHQHFMGSKDREMMDEVEAIQNEMWLEPPTNLNQANV